MNEQSRDTPLRFPRGLYGVTPDWDDTDRLDAAVRDAAAGGMVAVQLRLKTVQVQTRLKIAQRLRKACSELGILYIINDDWRLATEVNADGVHLGRDDGNPFEVREAVGDSLLIGVSCYADPQRAQQLMQVPADYVAFGAMYASGTKPAALPAPHSVLTQGQALARQYAGKVGYPRPAVVAIGGITPDNTRPLIEAGADSVAVIGALFNAPDIAQAAKQFTRHFSGSN